MGAVLWVARGMGIRRAGLRRARVSYVLGEKRVRAWECGLMCDRFDAGETYGEGGACDA